MSIENVDLKSIFVILGLVIAWFAINKITKKSKNEKAQKQNK